MITFHLFPFIVFKFMSGFFHCRDFLYLRDLSTFIEVGKKSEILRLRALNDVLLMIKTHAVSSVCKNYFLALYIIFSILPQILQVKAQLVLMCFHLQTSMFFLPYILIKYWQVFASMWSSHSVREINH